MISFKKIMIRQLEDYKKLKDIIPSDLYDEHVERRLMKYIGLSISQITVEFPFYDKDYLSTYYSHYCKKHRTYSKKCCRIHIEDDNEYYGYFTLRPTVNGTKFGRTYIKPELLVKDNAYLILGNFHAYISGEEQMIRCFPWMMQETDISVCAHVSAWTILRYYGNQYHNCLDPTMGEIVDKIHGDWGRKTPSNGLTPIQISDLFKEYGFSPIVRGGNRHSYSFFIDEILSYIESGIPVIGFIYPKQHTISMIGHGRINYDLLDSTPIMAGLKEEGTDIILQSRLITTVYAMEDNLFPYREVTRELPTTESDVDYNLHEVYYAVIPLYPTIHLVYNEVYSRYLSLVSSKTMDFASPQICRIYITPAASLKKSTLQCNCICDELKDIILSLSLPEFVWCIDVAGIEEYKKGLISGRVIIDTTCATMEREPWLLMHDNERIRFRDEDTGIVAQKECHIEPYPLYTNNLDLVSPAGTFDL